ncbi:hypothetical protein Hdeb2414_s0007g00247651 [Helianthus debilis subsp. tardiflorus]
MEWNEGLRGNEEKSVWLLNGMESSIPKGIPFPQNHSFHPPCFFSIPSPLAPFINNTTTFVITNHHPPPTPLPPPATTSPRQPPPPTRHRYYPQLRPK